MAGAVTQRRYLSWLLMAPLALTIGCSGGDDDDNYGDDDTQGDDDDTTGDDDTPATDELTLDNCETSIEDGVPAFFNDLFRCSTISTDGENVIIESIGLPPHRSYYYGEGHPNYEEFDTTRGNQYHPNPATISVQDMIVEIPLNPVSRGLTISGSLVDEMAGTSQYEYKGAPGGIALDSVALFHGYAAPGDDINQEKYTFDIYGGHPQNTGTYHYHSPTMGPLEALAWAGYTTGTTPGAAEVEIYGIMCDGTVVLGCTEADGSAVSGSLDAQGGHVSDITNEDGEVWFTDRYHTHVCEGVRTFTPEIQYYTVCGVPAPSGPPQ